jgi:steroid delta-isomerase-like uncharacterized protein
MTDRSELETVAAAWLSLWDAPVDWQRFNALHAEDFLDCSSAGRPPSRQGFADGLAQLLNAFPDLRTSLLDLLVDEARAMVAVRWSARGTNRARYLGVGPTGRLTEITGIEIIQVRAGRVVRRWGEWDISDHTGPS